MKMTLYNVEFIQRKGNITKKVKIDGRNNSNVRSIFTKQMRKVHMKENIDFQIRHIRLIKEPFTWKRKGPSYDNLEDAKFTMELLKSVNKENVKRSVRLKKEGSEYNIYVLS